LAKSLNLQFWFRNSQKQLTKFRFGHTADHIKNLISLWLVHWCLPWVLFLLTFMNVLLRWTMGTLFLGRRWWLNMCLHLFLSIKFILGF
jgi:hypothetical protein